MAGAKVAFAVAAHPDDIEFLMSGSLMLLRDAGFEIHYMNLANGNCGSALLSRAETAGVREKEARAAAAAIGAVWHPPIANDLEIFYSNDLLLRLGAVIRQVRPSILLVPSPDDYMEDHANTSRLAVTAAFSRGMPNWRVQPPTPPIHEDVTLYHALPYGLRDGMRRRVFAGQYVDVESVMAAKRSMLAVHRSQKEWLDASQGLDAYLNVMEDMCAEIGRMSGRFRFAEGWRRHSHLGFSKADADPLRDALGEGVVISDEYEKRLDGA